MKTKWQSQSASYLRDVLGLEIDFLPYPEARNVPVHLAENYEFSRCHLLNRTFLAARAKSDDISPIDMAKHAEWLERKSDIRVIYILDRLTAYNRKRLIEGRIPFLSPQNQLYVPDLGLDLRETLTPARGRVSKLSPAAQVVVLACALGRIDPIVEFTGTGLGEQFNYSKMTMARALDELRQLNLVEVEGSRRFARHRFLVTGRELWDKARSVLRTPVIKRMYLDRKLDGICYQAGEWALGRQTMLASDEKVIGAVTLKEWQKILKRDRPHLLRGNETAFAVTEIEVWRYDPSLLAQPPLVDPLSLALSLGHITDERIEMAVEDLIRKVSW